MAKKTFSDEELRDRLTPEQYRVTQQSGTERAFTGEYHDNKAAGTYHCVVCDEPLFSSETKYDSGTGWPSFWAPVGDDKVSDHRDFKMIVPRTENRCASCGAHLGHVFKDRQTPTRQRYCMNSASLDFVPAKVPAGDE
jgi:peptide-methionine (R)-S-oxide reductase